MLSLLRPVLGRAPARVKPFGLGKGLFLLGASLPLSLPQGSESLFIVFELEETDRLRK